MMACCCATLHRSGAGSSATSTILHFGKAREALLVFGTALLIEVLLELAHTKYANLQLNSPLIQPYNRADALGVP